MHLSNGTLLQGGKFKIEKMLGQGGFGITYLASQTISVEGSIGEIKTEIKLAIKEFFMKDVCNRDENSTIVSVPSVGSKELVERFKQKFIKEARSISKLKHPHIVKVVDIFEENGTAYYVMEYHNGGSLNDLVKDNKPLSEADAVRYITQIADAVGYIHKRNINHLDIKPGNILLDGKSNGILIDFGLSKQYDEQGSQTSSTPVGISHGYAPMEQYKQNGVSTFSPQSDIYSLGATLYKLVTGVTPPQAMDIFNDGLPELPAHLSDGVKRAIEQSLKPRKIDRPATAEEFIALLSADAPVVVPAVEPAADEATKIIVQTSEEALVEEPVEKPIEKPTPEPVKPAAPENKEPEYRLPYSDDKPETNKEKNNSLKLLIAVVAIIVVTIFVWFVGGGSSSNDPVVVKQPAKVTQSQPVKEPVKESVKDSVTEPVKEPVKVAKTEQIKEPVKKKKYYFKKEFSEGLACVGLNGKWGFVDKNGNEVIPLKYDDAWSFSEGLACVELNDKQGFIDKSGNEVIPLKYDDVSVISNGLVRVKLNGKYGLINKSGKEVVPLGKFTWVDDRYCEGFIMVELNGKFGFVDKSGNEVIPLKYDYARSFSNGRAQVELNGEWFSINKHGIREGSEFQDESTSQDETIYQVTDQQPEFPGGMQALMKFLRDNIQYPSVSRENNSQGTTYVNFVVNTDGSIQDVEVMKSSGDVYLDKEALRVIKTMPKWNPGKQAGKVVRVRITQPVSFRLQ